MRVWLALALALGGCAGGDPSAHFTGGGLPVGDYAVPVRSVLDQKYAGVVRQRFDFSCGSAALATLLRHHYDYEVGEEQAFRGMWLRGDRDQIRKVGFSLLDMKRWLESRGIAANGYRVPIEQLAKTGVPGIALITLRNYRHFVVVKGIRGNEVLLGDPSAGIVVMPRDQFVAAWNGVFFVLTGDQPRAKRAFNRNDQWAAFVRAPVGGNFSGPVSEQALALSAPQRGDI